jgi:hypothetical protein
MADWALTSSYPCSPHQPSVAKSASPKGRASQALDRISSAHRNRTTPLHNLTQPRRRAVHKSTPLHAARIEWGRLGSVGGVYAQLKAMKSVSEVARGWSGVDGRTVSGNVTGLLNLTSIDLRMSEMPCPRRIARAFAGPPISVPIQVSHWIRP